MFLKQCFGLNHLRREISNLRGKKYLIISSLGAGLSVGITRVNEGSQQELRPGMGWLDCFCYYRFSTREQASYLKFHFTQFNPLASNLDLAVFAAQDLQRSIRFRAEPHEVTRSVYPASLPHSHILKP